MNPRVALAQPYGPNVHTLSQFPRKPYPIPSGGSRGGAHHSPDFYDKNFVFLETDPPSPYLRVWMTRLPLISRTGSGTDSRPKWAKSIPVEDRNGAKTLPFEAAHSYMVYIREYSPGGGCMGFPSIKYSYAYIWWLGPLRVVQALKVIILPLQEVCVARR